jgi:hypothetical protein
VAKATQVQVAKATQQIKLVKPVLETKLIKSRTPQQGGSGRKFSAIAETTGTNSYDGT